jgi:hypothetical protein
VIVRARHLLIVLGLLLASSVAPRAEPWWPVNSPAQARYQEIYQALLADPGNVALLAAFAKEASRIGNYEAAIGALESILVQNPGLNQVRVELGVMYYRVRAYDVSRYHLERALASGTLPPKVERRARSYLETNVERMDGTNVSGFVSAGLRWDTNPLMITDEDEIFGVDDDGDVFIGDSDSSPDDDFAGFLQGYLLWREDLGNQYGETWDTTASTYWRWQFQEHNADIGYTRITTGPRLTILPGKVDHFFFRPYLLGTLSLVEHDFSNATVGGGFNLSKRFGTWLTPYLRGEVRYRFADDNDNEGILGEVRAGVSMALTEDLLIGFGGRWQITDAEADFRSSTALSAFVDISFRYDAPFALTRFPWELTLRGQFKAEDFDGVNPDIATGIDREDHEYRIVARNTVGLSSSWFLFVEGGAQWQQSNVPNYEADNQYVAVGATWRF